MPLVTVQELIDAGVHFGHQSSRWNPKMKPYIYGKRHKIHIINLQETIRGLIQASHFLRRLASTGAQVLFLGTKRQIRAVVESESKRAGLPAITERWIGGTLTNFATVRERLARLEELEAMETSGELEKYKKKDQGTLRREMRKIRRNLEGVRELRGMPGAIVVVDPRREEICIREAKRMNVPVVCILDTDCNPEEVDLVIPGNDDAMSSVHLLLSRLTDAIIEGRANLDEQAQIAAQRQSQQDDLRGREPQGRRGGERQDRRDGGGGRGGGGGGGGRRGGPGGPRGGGGGGGGGSRLTRRSTGRFADRHGGQADAVSFGSEKPTADAPAPAPEVSTGTPEAPTNPGIAESQVPKSPAGGEPPAQS